MAVPVLGIDGVGEAGGIRQVTRLWVLRFENPTRDKAKASYYPPFGVCDAHWG